MRCLLLALCALALLTDGLAAASTPGPEPAGEPEPDAVREETLLYRWELTGLARLLLPGGGEGRLSSRDRDGIQETELFITSGEAEEEEYYRYGSLFELGYGSRKAWSAYRFRDKEKARAGEIEQPGVLDVAAGIDWIRRHLPSQPVDLEIWSDGKIYPVTIEPSQLDGIETAGRYWEVRLYRIRGRNVPDRRKWKGSLDLWVSLGPRAVPVQIELQRAFSRIRLQLVAAGPGEPLAAPGGEPELPEPASEAVE